jgi:hypothetical protein
VLDSLADDNEPLAAGACWQDRTSHTQMQRQHGMQFARAIMTRVLKPARSAVGSSQPASHPTSQRSASGLPATLAG